MAHFAEIQNGIVSQVIVVANEVCAGGDFPESEVSGQEFIANTLKLGGAWKQTSYNANFRGKYAGIGDIYDAVNDLFVAPTIEESETSE